MFHLLAIGLRDFAIERKDHARVHPLADKRLRKRADHIGQSAGLYEGDAFTCSKQNFHGNTSELAESDCGKRRPAGEQTHPAPPRDRARAHRVTFFPITMGYWR